MTRGGRMTLWAVGALLLVLVGGVWLMLSVMGTKSTLSSRVLVLQVMVAVRRFTSRALPGSRKLCAGPTSRVALIRKPSN